MGTGGRHCWAALIIRALMITANMLYDSCREMQLLVLGCTFLMLSEREESTAENRQL
ncbi:unnamed protein product, partial [Staurois parvus]